MASSPDLTAAQIAGRVRRGELSATEVVSTCLERISARDPQLGAFQLVRAEKALLEAKAVDTGADRSELPLAGVPIAIKDNVPVAGEPMRNGSAASSAVPQVADHPVVTRLRAAGAIVVGLTRVPELCVFGATDSSFGITRNPWDLDRAPGGSSGGSAAAVGSGMVPVAHAADGMGSIRIPAASCGLVGIKPGTGLVPTDLGPNAWFGMAENGVLATTVADGALVLSVMAGQPTIADVREPEPPLRLAASTTAPVLGVHTDVEHARAVFRVTTMLAAAGHLVERADPPYPANPLPMLARWAGGTSHDAEGLDRSTFDRAVRFHATLGDVVRSRGLVTERGRDRFRTALAGYFAHHDVLVTPTLAAPPIPAERWGRRSWPRTFAANVRYAPYCAPWNFAGYAAVSVPAGIHPRTGTPLAVQLVAPEGGEVLLLGLAATIERLSPWARTAPAYA